MKEKHRLRVSENRVLRKICGSKRDEVTGGWRRLHNEELLYSILLTKYYLGDKIKKNEVGGTCNTYCGEERCIQGFGGETHRKTSAWKT